MIIFIVNEAEGSQFDHCECDRHLRANVRGDGIDAVFGIYCIISAAVMKNPARRTYEFLRNPCLICHAGSEFAPYGLTDFSNPFTALDGLSTRVSIGRIETLISAPSETTILYYKIIYTTNGT